MNVTDCWEGYYNLSVTVSNGTNETIENWALGFRMHGEIVDIWNAMTNASTDIDQKEDYYINSGKRIIIKNAGYNQDIQPYQSVNFGCTVKCGNCYELPENEGFIQKKAELSKTDYEISASITDYSYGSFNGLMTIVNRSDYDIEDWSVKFDSLRLFLNNSGIEIQLDRFDFYTADMTFTENGGLLLENRGFNSSIAAGKSLSLGFSGNCADKGNAGKDSMTFLLENAKLYDIRFPICQGYLA